MSGEVWVRSTRCEAVNCVEVALSYARSTRCIQDDCVEVAPAGGHVHVRDSKDPGGPRLSFTHDEWTAFLAGAKAGEFDL